MMLRVRRSEGTIELVLEGAGAAPMLQQGSSGTGWQALVRTAGATNLRLGPQRVSLPEAGLQLVSLSGAGSDYQLQVTPVPGMPLGRPVISADGRNLVISFATVTPVSQQTARLDLRQPGTVPQPNYAPPLQPRAVAPPLGDMAVGSMVLRNRSFINVSGPPVTMTLRNAPARDALMTLAQMGGYGFVFVDDSGQAGAAAAATTTARPVSIAFRGEGYSRALNAVLLAAGLQGRVEGSMILAGPSVLGKTFGAQVSKVYRLNQASASSAADYLASLGATITKVAVITNATTSGQAIGSQVAGGAQSSTTQTQEVTTTETYGASVGPLRGLTGTTDSRLQTITLVGDAQVVAVAENYLRQLDLRQRQVALSVKILDISLGNDAVTSNSFAFRYGNNFIVNDNGQLLAAFGANQPPGSAAFGAGSIETVNSNSSSTSTSSSGSTDSTTDNFTSAQTNDGATNSSSSQTTTVNNDGSTFDINNVSGSNRDGTTNSTRNRSNNKSGNNSSQNNSNSSENSARQGVRRVNPGLLYPKDTFFDFVQSVITSSSTKVLASPTLILSENQEEIAGGAETTPTASQSGANFTATIGRPRANESFVTVGEQVITNYTVQAGQNGAPNTCQPQFGIAGLTFGARISKIDDNGFVTFTLSPQIAASTRQQNIPSCGPIDILSVRRLDTGSARVRDGQTLILTGVISDSDRQVVSKWPILGDLPFVGQFFRNSGGRRDKRELVIMVTPRVLDDTEGGVYGYGYQPSTREARQFLSTPY
jgi:type IV pilus assembly protein PilQ